MKKAVKRLATMPEGKRMQLVKFLTLQRLETERNPKQKRKIARILDELERGSNGR